MLDVVALEDEGLAGGALPFLAAVHEHDALLGRGAQDVLILVDLDLDADRLETNDVLLAHDPLAGFWLRNGCTVSTARSEGAAREPRPGAPSAAWPSWPPGPDGPPGPA